MISNNQALTASQKALSCIFPVRYNHYSDFYHHQLLLPVFELLKNVVDTLFCLASCAHHNSWGMQTHGCMNLIGVHFFLLYSNLSHEYQAPPKSILSTPPRLIFLDEDWSIPLHPVCFWRTEESHLTQPAEGVGEFLFLLKTDQQPVYFLAPQSVVFVVGCVWFSLQS